MSTPPCAHRDTQGAQQGAPLGAQQEAQQEAQHEAYADQQSRSGCPPQQHDQPQQQLAHAPVAADEPRGDPTHPTGTIISALFPPATLPPQSVHAQASLARARASLTEPVVTALESVEWLAHGWLPCTRNEWHVLPIVELTQKFGPDRAERVLHDACAYLRSTPPPSDRVLRELLQSGGLRRELSAGLEACLADREATVGFLASPRLMRLLFAGMPTEGSPSLIRSLCMFQPLGPKPDNSLRALNRWFSRHQPAATTAAARSQFCLDSPVPLRQLHPCSDLMVLLPFEPMPRSDKSPRVPAPPGPTR